MAPNALWSLDRDILASVLYVFNIFIDRPFDRCGFGKYLGSGVEGSERASAYLERLTPPK